MNNLQIADTPETIQAYRLLALRQGLKLQIVGLKLGRGTQPAVIIRGILKQAGKKSPAKLAELSEVYAAHLHEIGVLVS